MPSVRVTIHIAADDPVECDTINVVVARVGGVGTTAALVNAATADAMRRVKAAVAHGEKTSLETLTDVISGKVAANVGGVVGDD